MGNAEVRPIRPSEETAQPIVRVLIAEDEEPLRLALCDLVAGEGGIEVVGAAASAEEAIELAAATKPDVVLVDVRMPGGGAEAARGVKELLPETRVLALSAYDDQATVIEMLSAGAVGYLVKGTSATEIVEAVKRAARGQASLSVDAISSMLNELVGDRDERQRAEGVMRRSEERFRGLVESAPDAVVVIDEGGAMQLVNAETERLFGYRRDEMLGQPIEYLLPEHFQEPPVGMVDPLGGRRDRKEFPVDISVTALETDEGRLVHEAGNIILVNEQTIGRRKDGSEFPVDISLAAIDTDQGRLATAFIRDVSERRRVEVAARQLAAIIESSDDAIIGKDVEGTIETWNLGAQRMFGYSAEEAVGRSIALLTPPDLPDDLPEILAGLRRGEEVEQYETKRMRKDEVVLDVVLKVSAIRDGDGQIVGTSSMARDVTKLKAQAELERERALLAHLVGAGRGGARPDRGGDPRRLHPGDHRGGHAAADPSPQPRRPGAPPAARRARGDDPAFDRAASPSPLRAPSARARHRWALRRPRDVHGRDPARRADQAHGSRTICASSRRSRCERSSTASSRSSW